MSYSDPPLNPGKKKKATKMLRSIVLIFRRSESQIHPNFSSLSASSKYMKSLNWFTQNRLLSHLRIATAGALIAAAVVSAIASFQPDPPNTRLTNDNGANGGYVSAYTLATGNPTPTRRSTSARSRAAARTSRRSRSTRATPTCCSAARTTTAASTTTAGRPAAGRRRPDLARLLPLGERRRELRQLARARAIPATPRRTRRWPISAPPAPATR